MFKKLLIVLLNSLDSKKHVCHFLKLLKHGVAVGKAANITFVRVLKEKKTITEFFDRG
jgi:hypothetical protein